MSVLIKGMEIPDSCHVCVAGYGGCCFVAPPDSDGVCPDHGRADFCPLVPVPPHGRLIDADALLRMCKEMQGIEWNNKAYPYSWAYAYENFENDIEDAPTIIEAEPPKEEK